MSPELQSELRRWLADATSESPSHECRTRGLCFYIDDHANWVELKKLFEAQGLDRIYPFCTEITYYKEIYAKCAHLNPERLSWVRMMLDVT